MVRFFLGLIFFEEMAFAFVPWATGVAFASVAVTMASKEIARAQENMLYDSRRAAAGVSRFWLSLTLSRNPFGVVFLFR